MGKDEDPGFTVVDRRGQESEAEAPPQPESPAAAETPPPSGDPRAGADAFPQIDFSTFCLSLATSAAYHLGLAPDPETGQPAELNLPLARQTIDTLALLQEKTRGNLDAEEEQLLQSLLTELRMRAVQVGS